MIKVSGIYTGHSVNTPGVSINTPGMVNLALLTSY